MDGREGGGSDASDSENPKDAAKSIQEPARDDIGRETEWAASMERAASAAAQLAESLNELVSERLQTQVSADHESKLKGLRTGIADIVNRAAGRDELESLQTLLDAWVAKPSDLLIMVRVAEEVTKLGAIVRAQAQISDLLADD